MTKLTDTQRKVLSKAAERTDLRIHPVLLEFEINGGARDKVIASLIRKGMLDQVAGAGTGPLLSRCDEHTLTVSDAALEALGIGHDDGPKAPEPPPQPAAEPTAKPAPRSGTKQATLITLLERPEGATIAEMAEATGWQQHTVRGAIAGALKKRLGLTVTSEKPKGEARIYRIEA